ncbi:YwqJ-related putative deaminase [Streptomyces ipomoeae]|uniref:YwqJ-related putative deaminase n=2 Tax=Streptomyces ipomoeae TaxID=103232 RepID=UPI0029A4EFC4|nr:YwqJ-related putative deaminase [Streptomyces ipomoeae]MDX2824990.1 YwqJ-related putative deaminase [Streptomyces ipomoeae]
MSDDIPVIPEEVPEFTGNLELLDQHISGIRSAGTSLKDSASDVHTRFGGLSAYYKAPEAEQLFATTAPVATKGGEFATELETVASALDDYAAAVGPLKARFEQLRQDAIGFRNRIAGDDEWRADGDLVEENNNRRSDINAAFAAFQAAERDCYNKIIALVGGEPLVVNDGSNKENMYGYRGEDLNNAGGLPWGDPVEESNPWYYIHEHVWDFAVGFVVDGVWGTIKGLGTLVGFNGWDAAGQAWVGLGKLATGIIITGIPVVGAAYWLTPADKLPSWLRDSRTAVVETGKALIAYDEWGKNPARAAGAVTFNVLTTVFTGGSGGAVAGAGKAGAIAKAISFAGKAGKIVDPMTYITKGVGATAVKISDVMASLRGITDGTHIKLGEGTYQIADAPNITDDLPAGLTPENSVRMETPQGEVVYLNTDTLVMHNADGTVRESLDGITHEGTAAERGADVGARQPELVGAGAKVGDGGVNVGRVGDDLGGTGRVGDDLGGTGRVGDQNLPGGRADNLPGGRADDLGRGPSGSHETPGGGGGPRGGDGPTGGGHSETPSGGHGDGPGGSHGETPAAGHGDTSGTGHGHGEHPVGPGLDDSTDTAAKHDIDGPTGTTLDPQPDWHGSSADKMRHHRRPAVDVSDLTPEEKLAVLEREARQLADDALDAPSGEALPGQHQLEQGCAGAFLHDNTVTVHSSTTKMHGQKLPQTHAVLQDILKKISDDYNAGLIEALGRGHGKCAEVSLISDRLHQLDPTGTRIRSVEDARDALEGSVMHTRRIGDVMSRETGEVVMNHGDFMPPCPTCALVLPQLGIRVHS